MSNNKRKVSENMELHTIRGKNAKEPSPEVLNFLDNIREELDEILRTWNEKHMEEFQKYKMEVHVVLNMAVAVFSPKDNNSIEENDEIDNFLDEQIRSEEIVLN